MVRNFQRPSWARLGTTGALTASLLIAAVTSPAPSAASDDHSDLHSRQHRLARSIDAQKSDVDEMSRWLLRTQARLVDARGSLQTARLRLDAVRADVHAAAGVDTRMQALLDVAVTKLRDARGDLARGETVVRTNRAALAAYAVSTYQSGGSFSLGIALQSGSAQEALDNLQAADTVLNKQSSALQQFQAARVLLRLTAQRVRQSKAAVARRRALAAANLETKRQLEAKARAGKRTVAARVVTLRGVRSDLAAAKRVEIHRLRSLQNERDRVDQRLRAIAQRRARQHARELAQARRQARALAQSSAAKSAPVPLPDNGFLDYPVHNTYITSPYGMRMHPILHILELHDGTDFHAPCGSPVYAAADGKVMEEYFNAGYGNRLLVDNGYVQGVSLATSYNHLTSYVVGVGAHVNRGQLIAYSGSTGWSTACHLHFMVYVNGRTVDPVTWL